MRVKIDIGLDFDGSHRFQWAQSTSPAALDVPVATLRRWSQERQTLSAAYDRWLEIVREIEDHMLDTEAQRHVVETVPARAPRSRARGRAA